MANGQETGIDAARLAAVQGAVTPPAAVAGHTGVGDGCCRSGH